MLALTTLYLFTLDGWSILYRISAGYCSIIVGRAYQSLQLNNRQLARVFLCPFMIIRGELFSLRKISCLIFYTILLTINFK